MQNMKLLAGAGKDGATRKKLELASGAILQYVGHVVPRPDCFSLSSLIH